MPNKIQISASILSSDFTHLADEIKKIEDSGADMVHVDVMDGHFVPPITIGSVIVKAIRPLTKLPIDAHLMVLYPWSQIDDFIRAGADIISIHAECYGELRPPCKGPGQFPKEVDHVNSELMRQDIKKIHAAGRKAYVVLNPGTPCCIGGLLNEIDGVLVMSVNPGFANQKFMPEVLPKLRELRKQFSGSIMVDGGVKEDTALLIVDAGADILVSASYFFGSKDPRAVIKYLKSLSKDNKK
ncbi:MAG: ribulose-phosphate 3-epimerase [Candidatus Omnitrophica bacterium]|nr:ribulose-phosphate 3-epimerase [Candidatus Omnitrophota bacterium]